MPVEGSVLAAPADLAHLLDLWVKATPDAVAIQAPEGRFTWRELDDAGTRLAHGYRQLGLSSGDRIASLMPNRETLLVHYLACFKSGLVATPLNYRYAVPEIDHALEVSDAAAILMHAERAADIAASARASALPLVTAEGHGAEPSLEELMAADLGAYPVEPGAPGDPAAIFFTSGSTGPPKGVTHSLGSLGWAVAGAAAALEMTSEDRVLPGSSMSHIGSFMWSLAALSVGAQVVLSHTFDAGGILPLLRGYSPTVIAMIPAALTALVRDHDVTAADFASLRLCRSGADHVPSALHSEFTALTGLHVDEGYGMTEVGLATLSPPSGEIRVGSIGRPVPGTAISLRDDDLNELEPGTVGRIWIRTPSSTVGYWHNPAATGEILREGWLDSGDLAHADDDGYFWFFGRKKQIIVHDGSNISPSEVENALDEHPAVELSGVVGVHDSVHGENVRAYVTLKEGAEQPTAHELIEFARERVGYKAPEEVVFLDEMPLNPTGKVDRAGIKRLAEDHVAAHPREH